MTGVLKKIAEKKREEKKKKNKEKGKKHTHKRLNSEKVLRENSNVFPVLCG